MDVVGVVDVRVGMGHRVVPMGMLVMLAEVEPHPQRHQGGGSGHVRGSPRARASRDHPVDVR